ncbi:uncharacterized protein LOC128678903 [Plodia interpunctella]|uniref:uncharacterized protein LOC128678903 n=1 Tax=Plodia interpunctella TaxID=58824 RepID=UPI0023677DE0|nr:uncharacterized protein LOC128678903 [Plodia interpunctella]
MATLKKTLPQGGTGRSPVGESLPTPRGVGSPTVSGGGTNRQRDASPSFFESSQPEAGTSDAESWMSVESLVEDSVPRLRRLKRGREREEGPSTEMPAPKVVARRGRPKSALSADARKGQAAARRDEAEKVVAQLTSKAEALRETQAASPAEEALEDQAAAYCKVIREIAARSGNLKGTFQKGLKDAAASLERIVSVLGSRSASEEAERLRAVNRRMELKVFALEKEMAEFKAAIEKERAERAAQVPASLGGLRQEETEGLKRLILTTVGPLVNARFEGIQGRLLPEKNVRPALAADKRRALANERLAASVADMVDESDTEVEEVPAPTPTPVSRTAIWRKAPSQPAPEPVPGKGKGKGKKSRKDRKNGKDASPASGQVSEPVASTSTAPPPRAPPRRVAVDGPSYAGVTASPDLSRAPRPAPRSAPPCHVRVLQPAPGPVEQPLRQVPIRGGARRPPPAAAAPSHETRIAASRSTKTQLRMPRLRPPRSAAVLLKVQADAEKHGTTYGQILDLAREKVDLGALGISGVKFKRAATGARILEIAGADRDNKADQLAAKLREVLDPQTVEVSRPQKSADLRVLELCDSATPQLVRQAIARVGQCPESEIRVGDIKEEHAGTRTAWVRCPVAAAKRLTASGAKLLVGWVSAKVKLLPTRPMQCYRCLEIGHVSQRCTAEADRSLLCYRCGELGHKAAVCNAAPKCVLCAGAGKPTGHRAGSAACPSARRRRGGRRGAPEATAQAQPALAAQSAEAMETGASE